MAGKGVAIVLLYLKEVNIKAIPAIMTGPDFKERFFHCKFRVVYVLKLFILIIYNLIDTYKNYENIKESIINFLAESSQYISLTLVENTFITSYSGKVTNIPGAKYNHLLSSSMHSKVSFQSQSLKGNLI